MGFPDCEIPERDICIHTHALLCNRNTSYPTKWKRVMEVSSFDLPNLQRVLREGCGGGTGALSLPKCSIVGPVNLHLILLYVA